MLLLGAVRCISACQFTPDPPKACHQHQESKKPCAQLNLLAPEAPDAAEAPAGEVLRLPLPSLQTVSFPVYLPAPPVLPPLLVPLRI